MSSVNFIKPPWITGSHVKVRVRSARSNRAPRLSREASLRPFLFLLVLILSCVAAQAATLPPTVADNPAVGLKLMKEYRAKPDPQSVPALMRALSERGAFKDPESSGVYVGFFAGVLGSNPKTVKSLIQQTLPLPFEDQWIVVRALAYSRLPNWQALMRDLKSSLPDRHTLIDYYLTGRIPTLDDASLEPSKPSTMDKFRRAFKYETYFGKKKKEDAPRILTYATNPELIDTHWGLYFATGKDAHLVRLAVLLPWASERDDVDKLTIGNMAKFTLAANAAYDVRLLRALKRLKPELAKAVQPPLAEVIEAAETADTGRIKKEALAAVDELRKKGPGTKRDIAWWGQAGQTALSAGCMAAALTGQVEFGVPCVVGGALSSAALRYLASPD